MSWGCWRHENWYILGKVCEIKSYIDIAHLDLHVLLVSANDTVRNDTVQALLGCEVNWNAHCQSLSFQCNGMIGSVSDPKRITFVGRACSCGCFWTGLKLKNSWRPTVETRNIKRSQGFVDADNVLTLIPVENNNQTHFSHTDKRKWSGLLLS